MTNIEEAKVLLADPPWSFENYSNVWHSNEPTSRWVGKHYDTMTDTEIAAYDLPQLASDCILFLWTTFPKLPAALTVMGSWGFKYKTVAFVWVKTTRAGTPARGMGYYTRSNAEIVLLGTRGRVLPRKSRSVPQVVLAPRRKHSEKPEAVQDRIEELFDGPYCELFARRRRPGWLCLGDELTTLEGAY